MKDLKKLRQQLADKKAAGRGKTEELNGLLAKSDASDAEKARIDVLDKEVTALEGDVESLSAEIAAEERQARRAGLFANSAIVPAGSAARSDEPNPTTTDGFKNLSEFAVSVRNAYVNHQVDPRLAAPANFHQNQGGAGEGFLVPVEYRQNIWELAFDPTDILGMVTPEPTTSNAIQVPKDETTPWGAAGVQAFWRAEAAQMTASKAAVSQMMLQLHELYAFVLATDEVLQDAPRLQNRLTVKAAQAIRWQASEAIMWGDGNGKPLGFMNSNALVTVAKDNAQAADTLSINNILNMSSRVLRMGGRPIWLANSDVEPQLASLTIGNIPFFLPNTQPGGASPYEGSIRGKPTIFSEHCSKLGDKGDIVVADLSGYLAATKQGGGIDFAASIHLFFDYGIQAFRWTFRLGGQPYLSGPVAAAKGANTKSHFVTLADRA